MSDTPIETLPAVRPPEDIAVTALCPEDMPAAQERLITWARAKVASVEAESAELDAAWQHAKKMKWRWDLLHKHWKKSVRVGQYYSKILAGLEAGLNIIPNLPVQVFAVRTDARRPPRNVHIYRWKSTNTPDLESKSLPAGEGEYTNAVPETARHEIKREDGSTAYEVWARDFADVEFPITMAKPQIMEATSRAMALKIFDDFGILPATRQADPVIVGRVLYPEKYGRVVTFLIAWHLDTRTL